MESILYIVATLGVLYWSIWEYRKYKRPQPEDSDMLPYSSARFNRRMGVSIILLLIIAMMSFRHYVEAIIPYRSMMIAYYGLCLMLVVFMALLALGDVAETGRQFSEARKQLVERSMSDLVREVKKKQRKKKNK